MIRKSKSAKTAQIRLVKTHAVYYKATKPLSAGARAETRKASATATKTIATREAMHGEKKTSEVGIQSIKKATSLKQRKKERGQ